MLGRGAIALQATWDPKQYQLTWVAQGAQMGPSNDMGFTWGQYIGKAKDRNGEPIVTTGRYITIWKKQKDGEWKVAMDASADDAPGAGRLLRLAETLKNQRRTAHFAGHCPLHVPAIRLK